MTFSCNDHWHRHEGDEPPKEGITPMNDSLYEGGGEWEKEFVDLFSGTKGHEYDDCDGVFLEGEVDEAIDFIRTKKAQWEKEAWNEGHNNAVKHLND